MNLLFDTRLSFAPERPNRHFHVKDLPENKELFIFLFDYYDVSMANN